MTNVDNTSGYFNVHLNELNPGTSPANCGLTTNTTQFSDMQRNYKYYYVYGAKITYHPRMFG